MNNAPLPLFASFAAGAPAAPSAFFASQIVHDAVEEAVEEYDIIAADREPELGLI